MKMLKSIGSWLYRMGGGQELDLVREALGIAAPMKDYFNAMDGQGKARFLRDLTAVKDNQSFLDLLGFLMEAKVDLAAKRASGDRLLICRGTMNGIALVKEELTRLTVKEPEGGDFDKFSAI